MKKTFFALAVALFCNTAPTQAQNPNQGCNNRPEYSNNGYNNRYYGNDRDPWNDGRQAYDRQQYNRNWVVTRGRRNHPPQGHWVYVPHAPQPYYAPVPPPRRHRYPARGGYAYGNRRW